MRASNVIAYRFPMVDVGREDEGVSYVPRMFRNAPGLFYVGRVHEQVFTSVIVRGFADRRTSVSLGSWNSARLTINHASPEASVR